MKRYIGPLLILILGPLLVLEVKFYSYLIQVLFNANNENSNGYGTMIALVITALAIFSASKIEGE